MVHNSKNYNLFVNKTKTKQNKKTAGRIGYNKTKRQLFIIVYSFMCIEEKREEREEESAKEI